MIRRACRQYFLCLNISFFTIWNWYCLSRVSPKVFTFAGTKDRRAKTTQEVTAYRYVASYLAICLFVLASYCSVQNNCFESFDSLRLWWNNITCIYYKFTYILSNLWELEIVCVLILSFLNFSFSLLCQL